MEIFFGAFTADWERKRAAFLHDLSLGNGTASEEEERRRRGGAGTGGGGAKGSSSTRRRSGNAFEGGYGAGAGARGAAVERSMKVRFAGIATGSQPAVVKMASFGGGGRLGAMVNYVSRNGTVTVENELGEELRGREALSAIGSDWDHLMKNRAESRDTGSFRIEVTTKVVETDHLQEVGREIVKLAVGDRSFAFATSQRADGSGYDIEGQVVLRSPSGERLTGDAKATEIVQSRLDASSRSDGRDTGAGGSIRFRFLDHGNGTEHATSCVRALVERHDGRVEDETGRTIGDAKVAGDLVQQEWRDQLHSRKPRDVMHLILSARAGTDATAFHAAAREFLSAEFGGHRYVFSIHDPSSDPKTQEAGGKRPHVHVHAIVAMRSDHGDRVETTIQSFRGWRETMAEKAREQGINMEMTDRRERASAAAYSRGQVRPTSTLGRTEHEGTSEAAQRRYDAKRADDRSFASTERSLKYTESVRSNWKELTDEKQSSSVVSFAYAQLSRLNRDGIEAARHIDGVQGEYNNHSQYRTNLVRLTKIVSEGDVMRRMSRSEFEAYEKRVETALFQAERFTPDDGRADFDEIATVAREHVNVRRELVEYWEEHPGRASPLPKDEGQDGPPTSDEQDNHSNKRWDEAVAEHGLATTREANQIFLEIERARDAIDRAQQGDQNPTKLVSLKQELDNEIARAAEIGVAGNSLIREAAETDHELKEALQAVERERQNAAEKREKVSDNTARKSADSWQTLGLEGGSPAGTTPDIAHRNPREDNEEQRRESGETNQTDPAKQHVSRIEELERERSEREDHDREDRER